MTTMDMFPAQTLAQGLVSRSSTSPYEPTLRIVRKDLFDKAQHKAVPCPCCQRLVKIYKRRFNSGMALALVYIYREYMHVRSGGSDAWVHVERLLRDKKAPTGTRGDFHKLRYFGLIEQAEGMRADGSPRNGYWRITTKGILFVEERVKVPTYAIFYNQEMLALDGPDIGIRQALGTKFNYEGLMK